MAYQANIPQATDKLKNSQADIQANFTAIKTLVDVNHGTFSAADQGKHKFVTLPVQGSSPATVGTDVAIYSLNSSLTGNSELCYRKQASGNVIEMTSAEFSFSGWSMLPSGLIMKWGSATIASTGASTVIFPVGATIPAFANCYNVMLTPFTTNPAQTVSLQSFSAASFICHVSTAGMQIRYLAFGD